MAQFFRKDEEPPALQLLLFKACLAGDAPKIARLLEGASSEVRVGMTLDVECEEKPRGCHLFKGVELPELREGTESQTRVSREHQKIQHNSPLLNPMRTTGESRESQGSFQGLSGVTSERAEFCRDF